MRRAHVLLMEKQAQSIGRTHPIVLCGRDEGFDERIVDILAPREVSLGDFVLGGGEVA